MLEKTISYTDYNGEKRTDKFYFNLEKSEMVKMDISEVGGFQESVKRIMKSRDGKEIMRIFEGIILGSYGEKDTDGIHFIKSPELSERFKQTRAYDELFMELITDDEAASDFINGITPDGVVASEEDINRMRDELDIPSIKKSEPKG